MPSRQRSSRSWSASVRGGHRWSAARRGWRRWRRRCELPSRCTRGLLSEPPARHKRERGDMPEAQLVADLRAVVGDEGIVAGDKLRERKYDAFAGVIRAQVLLRPKSTAQVSDIMRLCHAKNQVVVPHGGLTGLVYGTTAGASDIILSMEAMTRIEDVDVAG